MNNSPDWNAVDLSAEVAMAMKGVTDEMSSDPAWEARYMAAEVETMGCTRAQLEQLICTAPGSRAAAYLVGLLTQRLHIAAISGRPFN